MTLPPPTFRGPRDAPAAGPRDAVRDVRPVVSHEPLNLETAPGALTAPVTPTSLGYTRSNFATPQLDPATHELTVHGAVRAPLALRLRDLAARPQRTVLATMECAGNDRVAMRPLPGGEPWQGGAVSTSEWTGVPLGALLDECGLASEATHVLAVGADHGRRADAEGEVTFARAIPLDVARAPDTLLALRMNGEPLAPRHGAPVRLVVPGWYGMASVKWVARLEVLTRPFDGYFQRRRYVYDEGGEPRPVTRMRVKSRIVAPADGARLRVGPTTIWGWAWSGDGAVEGVEVAASGDGPWFEARLEPSASPHAWTRWSVTLPLDRRGRHVLRSRARDASGARQPDVPPWNRLGYGNNAVQSVVVEVVGADDAAPAGA